MTTETRALAELAVEVAHEAGGLLLGQAGAAGPPDDVAASARAKTSRTDLVTSADQASERLIVERLETARPQDGILAEEGSRRPSESGLVWVIDPLDGTINYLYGIAFWAVSIACQRTSDGRSVAGAVFDPCRDETFSAVEGDGAFLDSIRLNLGPVQALGEAMVGTGFSYRSPRRAEQAELLTTILPVVRDIRRAGAASLDLCWVAAGRLDGFYEAGLGSWDYAAGSLIVTEAGGSIEEIDGLVEDATTLVATAPGLDGPLGRLLRAAGGVSID